jgi:DNA-binding transcriptional regulator YiaG
MSLDDLFRLFGSQIALARLCGCSQSTVAGWKQRGIVPARRQRQILDIARSMGLRLTAEDLIAKPRRGRR